MQRTPSKGFRELAEQTGGQYFRIGDVRSALDPNAKVDLAPVFQAIEHDLRGQYVLGFYPGEALRDGRSHRLSVELVRKPRGLQIRALLSEYSLRP